MTRTTICICLVLTTQTLSQGPGNPLSFDGRKTDKFYWQGDIATSGGYGINKDVDKGDGDAYLKQDKKRSLEQQGDASEKGSSEGEHGYRLGESNNSTKGDLSVSSNDESLRVTPGNFTIAVFQEQVGINMFILGSLCLLSCIFSCLLVFSHTWCSRKNQIEVALVPRDLPHDKYPSGLCTAIKLFVLSICLVVDIGGFCIFHGTYGSNEHAAAIHLASYEALRGRKNINYFRDQWGVVMWMPFGPDGGCEIPAQQPFWVSLLLGIAKGLIFFFIFKSSNVGRHNRKDKLIFYSMSAYQSVILAYSLVMTIYRVLFQMSANMDAWHTFECFGLAVNQASWDTNAVMLTAKWRLRLYWQKQGLNYNLIYDDLDWRKDTFLKVQCIISVAAWLLCNIGFMFTHIVPGIFLFLWVTAGITILGCVFLTISVILLNWFTGYLFEIDSVDRRRRDRLLFADPGERRDAEFRKLVDFDSTTYVITILFAGIGIQLISTMTVYLYEGMDYWTCAWVSLYERQAGIYFPNFQAAILKQWRTHPWLADLMNETT